MGLFSKLFNNEMKDAIKEVPPTPAEYMAKSKKFHMVIEDVFSIMGRGTVVTGKVDSGEIHMNDTVMINETRPTEVTGIEMFRKSLDYAQEGDNVGLLLKDINRDDVHKGDVLTK